MIVNIMMICFVLSVHTTTTVTALTTTELIQFSVGLYLSIVTHINTSSSVACLSFWLWSSLLCLYNTVYSNQYISIMMTMTMTMIIIINVKKASQFITQCRGDLTRNDHTHNSSEQTATRSFAIAKRTARRSCLVDLVHCQHCFLRHMG